MTAVAITLFVISALAEAFAWNKLRQYWIVRGGPGAVRRSSNLEHLFRENYRPEGYPWLILARSASAAELVTFVWALALVLG